MRRLILTASVLLVVISGSIGFLSPRVVAKDVNNFTISQFTADYYLSKDTEGRSTLKTVEKITAVFPDFDQNHGLERALPQEYDGHSTSLKIESVSDGGGKTLSYSDSESSNNLVLRIGNSDTYVHGEQTYVITYTQRDTTRFFSNSNDDEFYWDVNGTQWPQAIQEVNARVHVVSSLAHQLNNKVSCYRGAQGSTTQCALSRDSLDGETVFSLLETNFNPYENVTFAIGFAPHTFAAYQPTWQEKLFAQLLAVWGVLLIVTSAAAVGAIVWLSIKYYKLLHRVKGRGTIVPEYLPPESASVLLSAQVLKNNSSDITAQIIDLAVRHYLKIYLTKDKTLFSPANYELEIVKPADDLRKEERQLLESLFGKSNMRVGSRFAMSKLQKEYALRKKLQGSRKEVRRLARSEYGLFDRPQREARQFMAFGWMGLIVGIITLSPLLIVAGVVGFIYARAAWPLTIKGMTLYEYLLGLELYIKLAEKERLRVLQSPEGAEKIGQNIRGDDPKQLVKLYERVLPYAILFGIEREWTKQLGAYYETADTQPDWYVGNGTFNAVVFSSAIAGFSTQSSSYSSSSSAALGGSGGGGSSGGGGGGGGGGGW